MRYEEWIKTLEDGRRVKFIYQELLEDGAFITAQLEGNEVVYSVVLPKQETRLVVKMLKVISGASFRRSSDTQFGRLTTNQPLQATALPVNQEFLD